MKFSCHCLPVFILLVPAASYASNYLNELPTPQRVMEDIQGTSETDTALRQCAAFNALTDEIFLLEYPRGDRGSALPREAFSKFKTYYDAGAQIMARRRLGAELINFEVTKEGRDFQKGVLQKYLSRSTLDAAEVAAKAKRAHNDANAAASANAAPATQSTPGQWESFLQGNGLARSAQTAVETFLLISLGLSVLIVIVALRNESGPRLSEDPKEMLRLPDSLRRISVFRKEYDVSCKSGRLYDREIWTETNVTTTTSGGGGYQTGGTVNYTPISTATHVSSTVYHRFWLRSADGREFWWRVSGDVLSATKGQVISRIDSAGGRGLMLYNHSTDQFATLRSWFSAGHEPLPLPLPGWLFTIIVGVALAGYLELARLPGSAFQTIWGWSLAGFVWVCAVIFVCAIPITILNAIFRATRDRQFEKRAVPAFRRFLKESTPELLARYSAVPT